MASPNRSLTQKLRKQTNLRDDGHLLTQVVEPDLRGENVVDVDLPLRFGQAEQSRDEGAFASAGSADDADLAGKLVTFPSCLAEKDSAESGSPSRTA